MDPRFTEPSLHAADGAEMVGRLPTAIPIDDLRSLGHPERPTKAIRAKCLDCSGGVQSEVRKCVSTNCSLWPFRMGRNPFWGKGEAAGYETDAD